MPAICTSKSINPTRRTFHPFPPSSASANTLQFLSFYPSTFSKFPSSPQTLVLRSRSRIKTVIFCKTEFSTSEWIERLPDKKKPLYSHSLPCIEAWLNKLGFYQSREDRAVWLVEKPDWHAQLSLDVTDLYIRYLKSGPGNLEKDVERRFSYALSREDIENAILGGP
ncbi:tRNA dimethylallyltransferase [Tasmannia lanceolata]|uniref:tRNA dimethylallyltransferase n=1 Tax=Tasmannia lanceolata TaxID=3420 RepID=UPI0040645583